VSKEEVLSELPRFYVLIHVIDGTDSKKLADAALFIYRVLINKQFQREACHYIILLNKEDEQGFYGVERLCKRIEDEVETIKSSRRSQPEDNEGEEDFLRNDRTRFDIKKQGIIIVVGSATSNIKVLKENLEELC
jgi:signal recognition particle receptor subunit beta